MEAFLSIIIFISSVIMICLVAVIESNQAGLGTLSGEETSLWGEHRGSSKKELQNRVMTVISIIFIISVIAIAVVK